jgi:hypothetical protein
VTINDTAPTGDQYNLSLVEILPLVSSGGSTYNIAGSVSPGGSGTLLTLSGAASATVTADSSGNYIFANLPDGSYTVTPSKAGYTFSPTSQSVTISGNNVSGMNFTASPVASPFPYR